MENLGYNEVDNGYIPSDEEERTDVGDETLDSEEERTDESNETLDDKNEQSDAENIDSSEEGLPYIGEGGSENRKAAIESMSNNKEDAESKPTDDDVERMRELAKQVPESERGFLETAEKCPGLDYESFVLYLDAYRSNQSSSPERDLRAACEALKIAAEAQYSEEEFITEMNRILENLPSDET